MARVGSTLRTFWKLQRLNGGKSQVSKAIRAASGGGKPCMMGVVGAEVASGIAGLARWLNRRRHYGIAAGAEQPEASCRRSALRGAFVGGEYGAHDGAFDIGQQ